MRAGRTGDGQGQDGCASEDEPCAPARQKRGVAQAELIGCGAVSLHAHGPRASELGHTAQRERERWVNHEPVPSPPSPVVPTQYQPTQTNSPRPTPPPDKLWPATLPAQLAPPSFANEFSLGPAAAVELGLEPPGSPQISRPLFSPEPASSVTTRVNIRRLLQHDYSTPPRRPRSGTPLPPDQPPTPRPSLILRLDHTCRPRCFRPSADHLRLEFRARSWQAEGASVVVLWG